MFEIGDIIKINKLPNDWQECFLENIKFALIKRELLPVGQSRYTHECFIFYYIQGVLCWLPWSVELKELNPEFYFKDNKTNFKWSKNGTV